ncbi:oxidoreductase [Rathayibacter sp. AY1G1]|jgi:NAD(P)-dependent dehydrogenase (short-subunit alcohol dehydrogenase family)|uniref:SDR family NAD(P)-dependent oxidoreductase n=1 Tax=unclassified Rathayibacter TaxID=2609250 RepID=UPI000CE851F0|nr:MULTISPECIES: SDR family NAD(P)-dependent oxidoreductase [unclassified Rathayibacter]PPF72378.1 oxidoreductase [Rathayibacter sp. AY1E6]PPG33011.1 oxidoreductase [Rathayibacter sp. AY2B9]PPG54649.1 oxidoreductase [Rathayibacter sp. AY1E9]PPG59213.1 oxidoreductase [Rathayibacter sp. AY1C5]PPH14507.1 oxidoreductase [Rathayibacter sp. AY1G1]
MTDFTDRTAIITGGAGGIGLATARALLDAGARVVLVDIDQSALDEAAAGLEAEGRVLTVRADVSDPDDVDRYVSATVDAFGGIDVFFNNAGIEGRVASIVDTAPEDFDRVIGINLRGAFLGLRSVLPRMIEQGRGSVINTSSVAGLDGAPGLSPYVASKHGVAGLTKSAALEVAGTGVRVNSIHPSPVNTRMMRSIEAGGGDAEKQRAAYEAGIPLGRYAEASDIAALVLFLASDESSFITGAQYRIDGGMGAGQ